ncbi:MAG: DUF3459 domain-containing protein [Rubrobacter sp.]|nr:DUF3459 domain-containing protein [Rubrobacter sp.]
MSEEHLWWQKGVVYQIYPRSFADSNGDGVGDLPGITGKLEYVASLGVDAVWLSPIFPSPMADFGYDVSDYMDIHPMFGTLEDFDSLVEKAHSLGLKVLLDYVPNHTSDEHEWFVESRSSRDNPKREWYIWRDAAPDGGFPNNWLSEFGGAAWAWDEATGQYYYRAYHEKQPDLNWRNPEVREAMMDVLRFWMNRGVDGFRVDAVNHLVEDESFRDDPPNPEWREGDAPYLSRIPVHTSNLPETHAEVAGMRRTLDAHGEAHGGERLLIGEVYLSGDELMAYYGEANAGFHMPTNMELVRAAWDARKISAYIESYEAALPEGAWPNWVVGNHDNGRIASRVGVGQARVAAMLLLTLRGTPTIYYGDEIGMTDGDIPPELERDPVAKSSPGFGRDPERTPMQWSEGENGGFSTAEPWLPVPDGNFATVESQEKDSRSMLALYRNLLALRRSEDALSVGSYAPFEVRDDLLAFVREHGGRRFLVALNFGDGSVDLGTPFGGRIVLSTHLDREGEDVSGSVSLRANEGIVVEAGG